MKFVQKIAAIVCIYCLKGGMICHAMEVKYVTNNLTGFVYYLSKDTTFLSIAAKLHLQNYTFPGLLLGLEGCVDRQPTVEAQEILSDLLQLPSMKDIDKPLNRVADLNQRQALKYHLQYAHTTYQQNYSTNQPSSNHCMITANLSLQASLDHLGTFLEQVSKLYSLPLSLWDGTIFLYPHVMDDTDGVTDVPSFYNHIIFPIAPHKDVKHNFSILLYHICKVLHHQQNIERQTAITRFFYQYPSQYGFFIEKELPSILAYALSYGYCTKHQLPIHMDQMLDPMMVSLAHIISRDLTAYIEKEKSLDNIFFSG